MTQEKDKKPSKKELSPEQREKLKKIAAYSAIGLIFCTVMFFIVRGMFSGGDKKASEAVAVNIDVPQAASEELPDNKIKAYEMETRSDRENERALGMNSLADYFSSQTRQEDEAMDESGNNHEIGRSVAQYQSAQNEMASFYSEPRYDYEKEAMRDEIEELKWRLDRQEEDRNDVQQQLELMEKSYEMAARYLPQAPATPVNPFETAVERSMDGTPVNAHARAEAKEPALMVYPDAATVVSALYQEVPDSVFMAEQLEERNRHFFSAEQTSDDIPDKNTLKVSVYETVTLKDGETVRLRLLEAARVAYMVIPRNTLLTAVAKVQGNRLSLSVTSIEHRERIIAVNLMAYDTDGQQGVFIPNSLEANAVREIAAGMGQSAGTSFTFSSNVGQQVASDAGRGLLQGASQYFGNKMREVKVTLKSGHRLFLKAS